MMVPELLTPAQMGRADALSPAHGVKSRTLMANAGLAVARAVRARVRPCRTLVLCGPGNNGGDGYVAARLLADQGWPVAVAALGLPREGSDAAWAAADWHGPMAAFRADAAARAELVIDAVFGAGLARDVEPAVADVLRAAPRLVAVDVPSGVDGATGAVRGYAPQAELTVTFFRCKPGHFLLPGRDLCGERVLADIGLPASVLAGVQADTFANGPALWRIPSPEAAGHKYARGHVTVLGGAKMTGAARLAAEAARRAGAGLVTIAAAHGADIYRAGEPGTIVSDAGIVVLLKGSDTIVAAPDGRAVINGDAPPSLATAGSGDVLSGIIAGLLSQGMAAFDAACAGVWLHGRCGALAGPGLIAEDLPNHLPRAVAEAAACR